MTHTTKAVIRVHRLASVGSCMPYPFSTNWVPKNTHTEFPLCFSFPVQQYLQVILIHIDNVSFLVHGDALVPRSRGTVFRSHDFGGSTEVRLAVITFTPILFGIDFGVPHSHTIVTPPFGQRRQDSFIDFACFTWSQVINLQIVATPKLLKWTSLSLFLVGNLHLIYTF